MKIPVWVLTIQHKHGANVTVHGTDLEANEAVLAYVKEWRSEPDDSDQQITNYFDNAPGEYWSVDQTELNLSMPIHLEHDDCKIDLFVNDGVVGATLKREVEGLKQSSGAYSHPITEEGARKSKERLWHRRRRASLR